LQEVVIIMMSIQRETAMKIEWNRLDWCWSDRYEEEYGHYFSDQSYIDITMRFPAISPIEATIY